MQTLVSVAPFFKANELLCDCCRTRAQEWVRSLMQIQLSSSYILPASEHLQCRKPIIQSKNVHSHPLRVRIKNVLVIVINNLHMKLEKVQSCVCTCVCVKGEEELCIFSDLIEGIKQTYPSNICVKRSHTFGYSFHIHLIVR